jgi:perosamine synthetase
MKIRALDRFRARAYLSRLPEPEEQRMSTSDPEKKTIKLGTPTFGDEEVARVREVLASGWVAGQGPVGAELERAFAARTGTRHAVAVSNCTAALHLCLLALGVKPGDEVIVADYTFPATGHSVLFVGAEPVFVDVRPDTWTADPARIREAITSKTRGIIAVDAFGLCADYDEIEVIARDKGLFLIEDAAAAIGSAYRDRPAGSFGVAACFSLHGRKGITCGEGGVVTTNDEALAAAVRSMSAFGMESAFARQGREELTIPQFVRLGYNYKLSEIHSAIASEQLKKLDALLERRRRIASMYEERLGDLAGVKLPHVPADRRPTWQSYVLTLAPDLNRDRAALALRRQGVEANIGTYASHCLPVYGARRPCPTSANLFRTHLAIPMHAGLTDADVERVAREVRAAILEERRRNGR